MTTLHDKHNMVVHYRNLKQYLRLGLQLTTVHRVLTFRQSAWLRPFVEAATKLRKSTPDVLMKQFAKLLVNALFGKTIEDTRKYRHIKLVTSEAELVKEIKRPTFRSGQLYNDRLVFNLIINIFNLNIIIFTHTYTYRLGAVELTKQKVMFDKPRYVGTAVLALAKWCLYDYHYCQLPKLFPHTKLLFTDTGESVRV